MLEGRVATAPLQREIPLPILIDDGEICVTSVENISATGANHPYPGVGCESHRYPEALDAIVGRVTDERCPGSATIA